VSVADGSEATVGSAAGDGGNRQVSATTGPFRLGLAWIKGVRRGGST
jgi:hypothetical protein